MVSQLTDEDDLKLSKLEEEPAEDNRTRRSFSQLSEYITCSEKFRLNRLVRPRVPKRPAAWLILGIAIHEALEIAEKKGHYEDVMSDYLVAYDRTKEEQLAVQPDLSKWINPGKKSTLETIDSYRERGVGQVERFWEWYNSPDRIPDPFPIKRDEDDGSPWVEVPFDIDLGGIRVIGFIDRVEEDNVVDIKSGDKKNNKRLQLGLYKVALKKALDLEISTGQFFMTKVDGRSQFGYTDHEDLSRYTEEYITDLFTAVERGIQNEVFFPAPSDFCGICDVAEFCREKGWRPIPLNWAEIPEDEVWWTSTI